MTSKLSIPAILALATAVLGTTVCVGACGGGGDDGGGSGGGKLVCTADAAPDLSCQNENQEAETGATCTVETEGGCPNITVTWTCENGEGGVSWVRRQDTGCDCRGDGATTEACSALPGCAWVVPAADCEADLFSGRVGTEGCYAIGCPYGARGTVGGVCRGDVCDDGTATTSGTGGAGGGGGGEPLSCTTEAPPTQGCGTMGANEGPCEIEVEGGCPTSTVAWTCVDGEGGPGWERSVDTHCDCTGDGPDEASCALLPGCAWATPDPVDCPVQEGGNLIDVEGCYRTQCGFGGWGVVAGQCRSDLCHSGG